MKLLLCNECGAIFSLAINKMKECDCGLVKGMYTDNWNAVSNGKGVALGMGTGSLYAAIDTLHWIGDKEPRDTYLTQNKVITWVRPQFAPGNPHTTLIKEEDSQDV